MAVNFDSLDAKLEANADRLKEERERYNQIVSKSGYLSILYSVVSVSMAGIIKYALRLEGFYLVGFLLLLAVFLYFFLPSIYNAIRLVKPVKIAYPNLPQYFYTDIAEQYKQKGITDAAQLNKMIKTTYLLELEECVKLVFKQSNEKSAFFEKAFSKGLISLFPFFIAFGIALCMEKEGNDKVEIVNYKETLQYSDSLSYIRWIKCDSLKYLHNEHPKEAAPQDK